METRFYQLQCLGRKGKLLASSLSVLVLHAWSCYSDKVMLKVTSVTSLIVYNSKVAM